MLKARNGLISVYVDLPVLENFDWDRWLAVGFLRIVKFPCCRPKCRRWARTAIFNATRQHQGYVCLKDASWLSQKVARAERKKTT